MQTQTMTTTACQKKASPATLPDDAARARVVALVNNPCVVDARVIREAGALAGVGYEVHVLAHWADGVPSEERVDDVNYRRIAVRANQKLAQRQAVLAIGKEFQEESELKDNLHAKLSKLVPSYFKLKLENHSDEIKHYVAEFERKVYLRILSIPRKIIGLFGRVGRAVVTGTGAELIRHARAYYRPAVALRPDVIHAHDLYTLLAGYLIAKRTGARLVYDSHELEVGRNGNFSAWELRLRARSERFLIKRVDAVITVCDSIADYLSDLYGIDRPTVVHNAPSVQPVKAGAPDLRSQLGLPESEPVALYVGSVTINRGLEYCVRALSHTNGVHLACVGPRHKPTEDLIVEEAERLGVSDRLHLVDPVPHDEVTSFVRSADVSLITIQDVCLSYRFCFPNKLLESLLTGLPIVVARLVELERIVEMTGAGVVVDQTDPVDIARGINEIISDRARYVPTPHVIDELRAAYSLEVQMKKLVALYGRLVPLPANN